MNAALDDFVADLFDDIPQRWGRERHFHSMMDSLRLIFPAPQRSFSWNPKAEGFHRQGP